MSFDGLIHLLLPGVRALLRDARSGELRLLAVALVIAVAAVSSVGFLSDRVGRGLDRNSAQMLGGDLAVQSSNPLPPELIERASSRGLATVRTVQFPSMLSTAGGSQLVSLKAVQAGYPLRGTLKLARTPGGPGEPAHGVPERGTVWVDAQVLALLNLQLGDALQVGDASMKVTGTIEFEPDRSVQFINVAPRAMINLDDLPATGLVGPGSRVHYTLLAAGPASAVERYENWLKPQLRPGQELRTLDSARPEITGSLKRAHQFLILVALLAVMIAAVAIALATRRFALRHRDGIAVMRCLGAAWRQLRVMLWVEFLLLALLGSAAGCAIGYGMQHALGAVVAQWFQTVLPAAGWSPVWQGLATGVLLLLGFSLPALAALRHVSPSQVLRREYTLKKRHRWPAAVAGGAAFYGLAWWISNDARLSLVMCAGFLAALGLFTLAAWAAVWLLQRVRPLAAGRPALRFALAGLVRRKALTITQAGALSIGLMVLLLLTLVRTDLLTGWLNTVPADAPNTFLINIQPDQRGPLGQRLEQAGLGAQALSPMVRGRLVAINGRAVRSEDYDGDRARRLVEREFNLSYLDALPASNTIIAGRWLDPARDEVSLEEGLAETLGIKLGDHITFEVAGQPVKVAVTSLRKVKWDSFDVNFFAVLSPVALRDAPATFITSFHLPPDKASFKPRLIHEFPNLTIFDVGAILGQIKNILGQAVQAVQLLFLFTFAAGLVVLAAAFASTRDERMHEAAVLRVLGASSSLLSGSLRLEMLLIGTLSGVLAASGAVAVAAALAHWVFEFPFSPPWWPWPAGIVLGGAAAWVGGGLALRGVLTAPPMASLREVA